MPRKRSKFYHKGTRLALRWTIPRHLCSCVHDFATGQNFAEEWHYGYIKKSLGKHVYIVSFPSSKETYKVCLDPALLDKTWILFNECNLFPEDKIGSATHPVGTPMSSFKDVLFI